MHHVQRTYILRDLTYLIVQCAVMAITIPRGTFRNNELQGREDDFDLNPTQFLGKLLGNKEPRPETNAGVNLFT